MIKKLFAILILTISLGFLSGCGNNTDIGKDKAAKIALEDAGFTESDVTDLRVTKDKEDGKDIYEVKFTTSDAEYEYEILSSDGEIIDVDYDKINSLGEQNQQTADNRQDTQSEQQNHSEQNIPKQNNSEQDTPEQNNSEQYIPEQNNSEQSNSELNTQISIEEASRMVLERVPEASSENLEIETDYDDGIYVYEGDIIFNNIEYEFKIDANTGDFLEWTEDIK